MCLSIIMVCCIPCIYVDHNLRELPINAKRTLGKKLVLVIAWVFTRHLLELLITDQKEPKAYMEATRTLQELGERFLANKKEAIVFRYITCVEVTRTLHGQVLQGILPFNKDNELNEKVPLVLIIQK